MAKLNTTDLKFYSTASIYLAAFLGGPMAAAILARHNFINLGKDKFGKYAFNLGILSTVLLLFASFLLEYNQSSLPNGFPLIYLIIIRLSIEKLQGGELKKHKLNNGEFYSMWKACGIGFLNGAIYLIIIWSYITFAPDNEVTREMKIGMITFQKNDDLALSFLNQADTNSIMESIEKIGIPAYEANILLLQKLEKLENLDDNNLRRIKILKNYCKLRIDLYRLVNLSYVEKTNIYDSQIQEISQKSETEISFLKRLE
jgi:hypothetical protein